MGIFGGIRIGESGKYASRSVDGRWYCLRCGGESISNDMTSAMACCYDLKKAWQKRPETSMCMNCHKEVVGLTTGEHGRNVCISCDAIQEGQRLRREFNADH